MQINILGIKIFNQLNISDLFFQYFYFGNKVYFAIGCYILKTKRLLVRKANTLNRKPEIDWRSAINSARQGNSRSFDLQVVSVYQNFHKKALIGIIGSEKECWEIYLMAVTKFWEKYILAGNNLPENNINGYLFMMSKNVYYDKCRKMKSAVAQSTILVDDFKTIKQDKLSATDKLDSEQNIFHKDRQNEKYLFKLEQAIQKLCDDCKAIIEENVLGDIKLKDLKEKIKYGGGYQAIVQKKKRCLKKLTKYFYQELD